MHLAQLCARVTADGERARESLTSSLAECSHLFTREGGVLRRHEVHCEAAVHFPISQTDLVTR